MRPNLQFHARTNWCDDDALLVLLVLVLDVRGARRAGRWRAAAGALRAAAARACFARRGPCDARARRKASASHAAPSAARAESRSRSGAGAGAGAGEEDEDAAIARGAASTSTSSRGASRLDGLVREQFAENVGQKNSR